MLKGALGEERLSALKVDKEWLHDVATACLMAREGCNPLAPLTAPGFYAWSEGYARLRELSAPDGWKAVIWQGLPMIESPDGQVAIVLMAGDERTGLEGPDPKTKRERGPMTQEAISNNWEQMSFLPLLTGLIEKRQKLSHPFTYILLWYGIGTTVRSELSLPFFMDEKRRVAAWEERIVVDGPGPGPQILEPESPIEVEVTRRPA
jgi:hypothetical protein